MIRLTKVMFMTAAGLLLVAVGVIGYIWIGHHLFGLNTSRLDPGQGPSWPMVVTVYSGCGAFFAFLAALALAAFTPSGVRPTSRPGPLPSTESAIEVVNPLHKSADSPPR